MDPAQRSAIILEAVEYATAILTERSTRDGSKTAADSLPDGIDIPKPLWLRVCATIEDGEYATAARMLVSSIMAPSDDVHQALLAKFPPTDPARDTHILDDSFPAPTDVPCVPIEIPELSITKAVSAFKRTQGASCDGFKPILFRSAWCDNKQSQFRPTYCAFANHVANGHIPSEWSPIMTSFAAYALTKPGKPGALRNIGVMPIPVRLAVSLAVKCQDEQIATACREASHYGIAIPAGVDAAAISFGVVYERLRSSAEPNTVIAVLDLVNAFPNQHRPSALRAISKFAPNLYAVSHWVYGRPQWGFHGAHAPFANRVGMVQGDALGSLSMSANIALFQVCQSVSCAPSELPPDGTNMGL
jgi:hypothetical protein